MSAGAKSVLAITGAGGIGVAIAKRMGAGQHIVLGDVSEKNLEEASKQLTALGLDVETTVLDVSDDPSVRKFASKCAAAGRISAVMHTAGVSLAPAPKLYAINLLGTAYLIDAFSSLLTEGSCMVVLASVAAHLMPAIPALEKHLATAPASRLLDFKPIIDPANDDTGKAYSLSKMGNLARVRAAAPVWGARGVRINSVSPGVIDTPMSQAELADEGHGAGMRHAIAASALRRMGSPDELAAPAAFLASPEASFITGTDLLVDGGFKMAMSQLTQMAQAAGQGQKSAL